MNLVILGFMGLSSLLKKLKNSINNFILINPILQRNLKNSLENNTKEI